MAYGRNRDGIHGDSSLILTPAALVVHDLAAAGRSGRLCAFAVAHQKRYRRAGAKNTFRINLAANIPDLRYR